MSLALCLFATVQAAAPPPVDEAKVDQAIKNGVAFLRGQIPKLKKVEREGADGAPRGALTQHELVLLTLVHAGVPENDPDFKALFKDMLERSLEATYCVALQVMILEEIDRVKWQWRIRQCAQFLVDNQAKNGQWSYGSPTIYTDDIPSEAPKKDVASGKPKNVLDFGAPVEREKPKVKNRVKVEKKKDGPGGGDNSNTQYAALGSRACHDAGIILPAEVVERALAWWRGAQKEEGGDPQKVGGARGPDVASGGEAISAEPRGWCYGKHADHKAYGSMTAGATGGLAIWIYIKDNDEGKAKSWKKDKDVHEGLAWLGKNFSVTYNPGFHEHGGEENSQKAYYYYLYGLERAGMLYGTDWMGAHAWYPEGAKVLVESQKAGGGWGSTVDTCFAVLFLKRATRPLVATEPAGSRK